MANLFMWIAIILLFLGLPAAIVLTIIAFIKKGKIIFKLSIPIVLGAFMFFIVLGAVLLPDTEVSEQEPIKAEKQETEKKETSNKITEKPQKKKEETVKKEKDKEVSKKESSTNEKEKTQLTKSEYKKLCQELYYDDFFKKNPSVGELVKVHVMASEKYKYHRTDMWGIIVEDITEKYNLEMNSLGCTVMHESTKNDAVPSYFGEQIYVMFQEGGDLSIDTFKTGKKFTLYGEVIQNKNGIFILPKYYETEK